MRNRVEKPILSARVLALVGALCAGLAACQSAPPTSKEPPVAASAPAAAQAAAPSAANPQLQGPAAPAAAPVAPAAVKLTGVTAPASEAAGSSATERSTSGAGPAALAQKAQAPLAAADKAAPKPGDKGAQAKAPEGKTVQGAVVNEEPFSTWLQVTSPAKAGAPVQLEAVLVAKPPYHCNEEYPHKFKLSAPPAGLSYPEETVRGMKVAPERSVLAIPVNAQSSGKPTVSGTLSFSVCTEERCLVEKRELSVALDVM